MPPLHTYKAAREVLGDTDVVHVVAEGNVNIGTTLLFRFVVEQNPKAGLNAKVRFVTTTLPGLRPQVMVPFSIVAELSIPEAYDRVIIIDDAGEHTIWIQQPPFKDWSADGGGSHPDPL
jgi:hypothetical protein